MQGHTSGVSHSPDSLKKKILFCQDYEVEALIG